jgi:hypothetical protein
MGLIAQAMLKGQILKTRRTQVKSKEPVWMNLAKTLKGKIEGKVQSIPEHVRRHKIADQY